MTYDFMKRQVLIRRPQNKTSRSGAAIRCATLPNATAPSGIMRRCIMIRSGHLPLHRTGWTRIERYNGPASSGIFKYCIMERRDVAWSNRAATFHLIALGSI